MKIEILGTGCPKCKKLMQNVEEAVKDLNIDAEVIKITDINDITNYGVLATPAFAVDGEVKSAGKVAGKEEIKGILLSGK
jgi:small redox-active disulfide protein 2